MEPLPPSLSAEECAKILGKSYRTVLTYLKQGKIKHFKIGRELRVYESDLQAYLTPHKGDR